jgi:DNA primase catalytic core
MKENTPADGVKHSVNLADLIRSKGVTLKKVGRTFVGLCPFHKDRKPSFTVDPAKSLWHCFGCNRGGDVFTFLQELEGLSFRQALGELSGAGKAGGSTGGGNGGSYPEPRPAGAHPILGRVIDFYHQTFYDDARGLAYLRDTRHLHDKELYNSFRIGFANGSLFRMIPKSGEVLETLKSIGLITASGREFFHERVIIPISNEDGEIVGVYGRSIDDSSSVPHLYLPGPHRGVFNWQAAKRSREVFLTEGILDALSIYQAGCRDVISLYGAKGLTPDHVSLFRKYRTKKVFLALDSDAAGEEACQTIAEALSPAECTRVIFPVKDANDFFREHTGDDFKALCAQALPVVVKKEAGNAENPEQPEGQATKEILDGGFSLSFENISYRVKLISSFDERLRVTIKTLCDDKTFLDTIDLYSHRSRQSMINQLSKKFSLSRETVERHILAILDETEAFMDERACRSQDSSACAPQVPPMSGEDKEEAMAFLRSPNIVKEILGDMEVLGYVGEPSGKLLAYLIGISRKLDRPLSGIISSSSGAGKSHLAELVESLTPPEDVILFSRLSPQALGYMEKDFLKRKLLIIEERKGSEAADYSIRTLQSRQKLTQGVVIKDPATGRMQTKTYTVEGPIAYLETTTDGEVNPENSTRCFELFLDESTEQTEKVQAAQRTSRTRDGLSRGDRAQQIVKKHQNAQRLLEMVNVVIPYAPLLRFPSKWLRTRRDNERFLCLIEAICFLHQHQRERHTSEESGGLLSYIEATLEDYRLAYALAKDVLSHTLHDLRKHSRELLEEIIAMAGKKATEAQREPNEVLFSRREIREYTCWSDRKLKECLSQLEDLEYLEVVSGSKGKTFLYQLPERFSCDRLALTGLMSPSELEEKMRCCAVFLQPGSL